jgi:hypothetical protein
MQPHFNELRWHVENKNITSRYADSCTAVHDTWDHRMQIRAERHKSFIFKVYFSVTFRSMLRDRTSMLDSKHKSTTGLVSKASSMYIATSLMQRWQQGSVRTKTNSVSIRPQVNSTDWATATCWLNLVPTFANRGLSRGQRGGSPRVVNLSFLDRSR